MDDDHAADWAKFVGLHRTNNLFDADTNKLFTQHDMDNYAVTLAPAHMRGKPAAREWADDLMKTWPELISSIPKAVTDAASTPVQPQNGAKETPTSSMKRSTRRKKRAQQ